MIMRTACISCFVQVLAFIAMVTAAVARANVDDINEFLRDKYVDDVDLKSVFGYTVAISVFVLIGLVITIIIRILGLGLINQYWIVFGIMVSDVTSLNG